MSTPPIALRRQTLGSWGRNLWREALVARPRRVEEVSWFLAWAQEEGHRVTLRGAGRSYGDAALGDDIVLDLAHLSGVEDYDEERKVVQALAGTTIDELWRYLLPLGAWPAVVPGTAHPTLGGCLGHNIHGKNAWRVGPIGDHIESFDLVLADGSMRTVARHSNPELFFGVCGAAGLLGVVTRVRMRVQSVECGWLRVEPVATPNLEAMFECFEQREEEADYLVGWIDAFARGSALGRGLVHAATEPRDVAQDQARESLTESYQDLPSRILGVFPKSWSWIALRPFNHRLGMRLVNTIKYRLGRREHKRGAYDQSRVAFSFLLDYVPNWERCYGPGGLVQWQCFLPEERARSTFALILEQLQRKKMESFLAVFKRHKTDAFLVSHGVDGYSLALDFPARWPGLAQTLDELSKHVVEQGGRFYLAKDSLMSPAILEGYLDEKKRQEFQTLKEALDPKAVLDSAMGQRLGLGSP